MAAYKTIAISLKASPFSEADKLVTLFTRDHGKIRAIAKGARRIPSRLGGRVEPFTYSDCFIAKGRSLDIISQCEVFETFQKVREDAAKLPVGIYMLKLINSGTAEGQQHPELFDLLLKYLKRLKQDDDVSRLAKGFEKEFVQIEGIYHEGIDPQYALIDHLERDIRAW